MNPHARRQAPAPRPGFTRHRLLMLAGLALCALALSAGAWLFFRRDEAGPPGVARQLPRCVGRYDLAVSGGRVLDGLGGAAVRADVGVRAGRIACVGLFDGAEADRIIDATGLLVAPGLIDVHTHVERNLPEKNAPFLAPNFVRQGVTTIITGNCGRSVPSPGALFDQLGKGGAQVNVASLTGHNTLRRQVMGRAERAPTARESAEMRRLVGRAMDEGALGLSTGLVYAPGKYARREELIELARAAAERGGIYVTHMRDEGTGGPDSIREAIEIGAASGAHVHISHFKAQGRSQWGTAARRLALLEEARGRGQSVTIDQYPYTASSTALEVLVPTEAGEDGARAGARLRGGRAAARDALLLWMRDNGWSDFSFARVAYCPSELKLNGLSVSQIADLRRAAPPPAAHDAPNGRAAAAARPPRRAEAPADGEAARQADVLLDIAARGGAQMIYFDMDEADVVEVMRHEGTMFGSDSGVRLDSAPAVPHPRGLGTFPRVLSRYVRETHTLSLPDAISRMTDLPARTFGVADRGRIAEGYWADLMIFDEHFITDQATYDKPLTPPSGILYTVVNGIVVMEHGTLTKATPGQAVRRR